MIDATTSSTEWTKRNPAVRATAAAVIGLSLLVACSTLVALLLTAPKGGTFTGATGLFPGDQLQYMAWIRDASRHFLAADLYDPVLGAHVYIQPMIAVSALLVRIGVPIQIAWLVWLPVSALALGAAAVWYATTYLVGSLGRLAAALLAVFVFPPVAALADLGHLLSGRLLSQMVSNIGGPEYLAGSLLGYYERPLAVALTVGSIVLAQRNVERPRTRTVLGATACALATGWLQPWQGTTLLCAYIVAMVGHRQADTFRRLLLPAIGAILPLLYYEWLGRFDSAWRSLSPATVGQRASLTALVLGLGPLLVVAALGVRRPRGSIAEYLLFGWLVGVFATFILVPSSPSYAFVGVSFPVSVLIVRGFSRLVDLTTLPSAASGIFAALLVLLVTVPGAILVERVTKALVNSRSPQPYYLSSDQAQALDWLRSSPTDGAVLADPYLSQAIPAFTDQRVFEGHPTWTHNYTTRVALTDQLFAGKLTEQETDEITVVNRITSAVADCGTPRPALQQLSAVFPEHHDFGCVIVFNSG